MFKRLREMSWLKSTSLLVAGGLVAAALLSGGLVALDAQGYLVTHSPRGAAAWAPTDASNIEMWLKTDAGLTTDVGATDWEDQSGNGNDVTQTTDSLEPAVTSSWQNGLDGVAPDGTDDEMDFTSNITASGVYTIAMALEYDGGSQAFIGATLNAVGLHVVNIHRAQSIGGHDFFNVLNAIPTGKHIVVIGRDSSDVQWGYVDGDFKTGGDTTSISRVFNSLFKDSGGPWGAGTYGEIIVWLADHEAIEDDIYTYLSDRWAL